MTGHTITITRTVAAPPETVFAAWVQPERLATWWWPQLAGTTYDVDARPGGGYRIESPVIGATVSGVYSEVDPPYRLAFTWVWEADGEVAAAEPVEVSLAAVDGGTQVEVSHVCGSRAAGTDLTQGWNDVLDRLVDVVGQSTSSRS
ncbi:SRPBCC family protein [Nocardioides cynanchi]|uniref:SRPBCC family protein n=1 Tax=Nocardioides cynanchi TaxID=2558918 RepID=UPI001783C466|nr:SRPBCC domain-containing protein [Nocardioides cynanchi]